MAAGHGGQVLVSGATELLVRDDLPDGCGLVDLGEHRLRDLARPVRIFQLTGPGLRGGVPAAADAGGVRREPAGAAQLVRGPGRRAGRAGRGGAGLAAGDGDRAGRGGQDPAGGAGRGGPAAVLRRWRVAVRAGRGRRRGVDGAGGRGRAAGAVRGRACPRRAAWWSSCGPAAALLLVLDNCEHLAGRGRGAGRGHPARLPGGADRWPPAGRRWAWSGEQVFGLRPLSLPPPDADMAAAGGSEAVDLFVQRAAAARGDFALGPANVAAVGEICRRLDGIPLAIELAAARVAALRPAEIAGLLDERFRLLTRGRADAARPPADAAGHRRVVLRAARRDRAARCSTAWGSSRPASTPTRRSRWPPRAAWQRWDVLDGLTALVGQSLVAEEEGPDQASRYRLLETMRAYARQHLTAAASWPGCSRAHARHYTAFAERAGPELAGPAQLDWQHRIRAERDNLQAAVTWALASGGQAPRLAFRIVTALVRLRRHIARDHPRLGRSLPHPARRVPARVARTGPRRSGVERVLRRRLSAGAAAGRAGPGENRHPAIRSASGCCELLLALICTFTGQPERGASIAREARQEAAERGIEVLVGVLAGRGGDGLDRRRRLRGGAAARDGGGRDSPQGPNPALSAFAFLAAAAAIWRSEPQAALAAHRGQPGPDPRRSLRPRSRHRLDAGWRHPGPERRPARSAGRAAGSDGAAPRRRQPAVARRHAPGRRRVLARLGEAEPAAVLSGAFAAHFPASISAVHQDERMAIGETQALARPTRSARPPTAPRSAGAPRWTKTRSSGTRWASSGGSPRCSQQPGAPAPEAPPGPASGPQATTTDPPRPA